MRSVAELLGQDTTAARILETLEAPGTAVVRLTGPAGSGKSHIAFLVGATWRDSGGTTLVALGDDNNSSRSLYPLLSGLSPFPRGWTGLAGAGSRSALQVAGVASGTGGAAASIFDLLTAAFRQRTERILRPYSNAEREILLDLKRLARSHRLLLIAENAHWWDPDSLQLLREIVSAHLRTAIPQLASVVVLLVDTALEQPPSAPELFNGLTEMSAEQTWTVTRCSREQFPEVLKSLGLTQQLPASVLDALFSATGGHLKLAEQLVLYSEHHSLSQLTASGHGDYLATLLAERIGSLGALGGEIMAMLARAAVIGLSFEEKDLLCLADELEADLPDLIDRAQSISLLTRAAGQLSFTHDVVRSAILHEEGPSQLTAYRKQFEKCLSILRPGDYIARADVLLQAGDTERGRELFAIAVIDQLRRGVPASRVLRHASLQFPEDGDLQVFLDLMATSYLSVASGDFTQPLPRLKTPLPSETPLMAAERNYLSAICSMELQTAAGVHDAETILSSWQPTLHAEVELSLRFLLLLQQAQVLAETFDDARVTESAIERRLLARARYDLDAAVMLQVQNRRSAALNVPEVAKLRIQEAVTFFRRGTGDATRDRLELFRALTNLAAIQIRLGEYTEAYASAQEGERVVVDAPDGAMRLDVLASNMVLAGVRSGATNLADAITSQRLIIESPEGGKDKFIHRCNLGAYLLLSARDDEAAIELEQLGEELRANEFVESYLVYYRNALNVARAALQGDAAEALDEHVAMDPFVQTLKWPCAPYIRRRQSLLGQVLRTLQSGQDRVDADAVLLSARPAEIGPAWNYYARLVPCCELSFWSES